MTGTVDLADTPEETQGFASVVSPVDHRFSDDGIILQTGYNVPQLVFAGLSLEMIQQVRKHGAVSNMQDFLNYKKEQLYTLKL